ncbi:HAD-IIIA family hydrolase [Paenibacillus glycanilyticus]|uniref:D,D-heptose 1,7-bisphosphate phosphatase n=1 Tax=Paenibacillus glycanilyticus TaxID=126569 RepID=A0ABQ6GB86_9BACL|nr:HAD-IIIA family hydrolase [Paenibacillus glycanilyticus]GLX66513.1 D,D-heptose 1,7-bisphosphate phosphatase [Paenibacillus glycanilyticus]
MSTSKKLQAVFIDRDGTIGGSDEVIYPGVFELFSFSEQSIHILRNAGVQIYAFTNQPGISRGESSIKDFQDELASFGFDKAYICPHQHEERCFCRKPSATLLIQAAEDNDLVLNNCAVIGDRWSDMIAAIRAGCTKVLVKTGSGEKDLAKYQANQFFGEWLEAVPDYIAEDLLDAVNWLLKN